MRYPAAEKREIIELVERSSLPVRRTLAHLGIPKSTFYGWYARYRDVTATLSLALEASGLASAKAHHRPRLLSDNGPSYVSAELRHWLDDQGIGHTRGAPYHPMTQGKIERWHRSMKNQVLLENYYFPGDLKARIGQFVHYYNTQRYHESLNNLTPELNRRHRIKQKTLAERRRLYYQQKVA
jgi:transposase InsO family protein